MRMVFQKQGEMLHDCLMRGGLLYESMETRILVFCVGIMLGMRSIVSRAVLVFSFRGAQVQKFQELSCSFSEFLHLDRGAVIFLRI